MRLLRGFLLLTTVLIYAVTVIAAVNYGINWPAVYFTDLVVMNWRSQFNTDFLTYLLLSALWISWREGFTLKGHVYGFLNVFWGGMFTFPYLLYATYQAKGNASALLLGVHAMQETVYHTIS